jgi:hypothetical protein
VPYRLLLTLITLAVTMAAIASQSAKASDWPKDHQAGECREDRVDAHEHAEEPGRDPPQRQQVRDHRDRRAQQAG